jgi:hypothetical protein
MAVMNGNLPSAGGACLDVTPKWDVIQTWLITYSASCPMRTSKMINRFVMVVALLGSLVPALAAEQSATARAGVVSVAPQIPDLGEGWGERNLIFAIDPIEHTAEFVNEFAGQNPTNREAIVQTVRKALAMNGSVGMAEFWYKRSGGHLELVISRYPDQHLLDKHWKELTPKFDPKAVAPRVGQSSAWLNTGAGAGRQFVFVFRQGLYTGWVECKTELSGQPLMQLAEVAAGKMAKIAGASNAAPPQPAATK